MLFPQDVADRIRAAYTDTKPPGWLQIPTDLNKFLTPLRASFDFSGRCSRERFWIQHPGRPRKLRQTNDARSGSGTYLRSVGICNQPGELRVR